MNKKDKINQTIANIHYLTQSLLYSYEIMQDGNLTKTMSDKIGIDPCWLLEDVLTMEMKNLKEYYDELELKHERNN